MSNRGHSEGLDYDPTIAWTHHNINPDCPGCQKPVYWSKHLIVSDRAWHIECFKCAYCLQLLKPGDHCFQAGKVFCRVPCYERIFVGHCAIDSLSPEDAAQSTCYKDPSNQRCFCCNTYYNKADRALHDRFPACSHPGYAPQQPPIDYKFPRYSGECVRCKRKVFAAEYCFSMDYPWHISCLRCCSCNCKLSPGNHSVHEGLPFCSTPCYGKVFGIENVRRGFLRGP